MDNFNLGERYDAAGSADWGLRSRSSDTRARESNGEAGRLRDCRLFIVDLN